MLCYSPSSLPVLYVFLLLHKKTLDSLSNPTKKAALRRPRKLSQLADKSTKRTLDDPATHASLPVPVGLQQVSQDIPHMHC